MTTPRRRAFVSITAILMALVSTACFRAPSPADVGSPTSTETRALTIRFDNSARERVHVYLMGMQRGWLLGRVEPGVVMTLAIPEAALAEGPTNLRLAVLVGERASLEAARRAPAQTVSQPASAILSQRWRFSRGEIIARGR